MARNRKSPYESAKRQKELDRLKKKEQKLQNRLKAKETPAEDLPSGETHDTESDE